METAGIVVSKRLGHAIPSTTLNTYARINMESHDEPARIMDEILTPVLSLYPDRKRLKIPFQTTNLPFSNAPLLHH